MMLTYVVGVIAGMILLVGYFALGLRRIKHLKAPYQNRQKLLIAFARAGGPLRPGTDAGLGAAKQSVAYKGANADFDRAIRVGVSNNFSHPGASYPTNEAREAARRTLSVYALEEADRERANLLGDMAIFLCCMHTPSELQRLSSMDAPMRKSVVEGRSRLIAQTAAACVGAAVKRLRAEGGMHPAGA